MRFRIESRHCPNRELSSVGPYVTNRHWLYCGEWTTRLKKINKFDLKMEDCERVISEADRTYLYVRQSVFRPDGLVEYRGPSTVLIQPQYAELLGSVAWGGPDDNQPLANTRRGCGAVCFLVMGYRPSKKGK